MESSNFKAFVVVEFTEEIPKTVEFIPSTWLISEKECFWPTRSSPSQFSKLRQNKSSPNSTWGRCVCRILGQFESHDSAKQAAKTAEVTSEIDSPAPGSKRKRSKSTRASPAPSSSSDDLSEEAASPKKTKNSPPRTFVSAPISSPNFSLYSDSLQGDLNDATISSQEGNSSANPLSLLAESTSGNFDAGSFLTANQDGLFHNQSGGPIQIHFVDQNTLSEFTVGPQATPSTPVTTNTGLGTNGFQRVVLKQLAAIQQSNKDILKALNRIIDNTESQQSTSSTASDSTSLPVFPLETDEALLQLDQQLHLESDRSAFIRYLSGIGGANVDETVKGILRRIFSPELAQRLTYTGKGENKKPFNIYSQVDHCITAAVKRNKKISNEGDKTEAAIRKIVMDFLRYSRPQQTKSLLKPATPRTQTD